MKPLSVLGRFNRAYRAFTGDDNLKALIYPGVGDVEEPQKAQTTLAAPPAKSAQKYYNYNLDNYFTQGGLQNRQLARNIWGANLAYQTVPEVKAALDVIAENAAIVPMMVKDDAGNIIARSDENPEKSPLLMAILDSQSHYGISLISLMCYALKMGGMSFVEIVRNRVGFARGLKWMNPAAVEIDCYTGKIEGYWFTDGHERQRLSVRDVLMLRDFNPADDIYGYGTTLNILGKANVTLDFDRMVISYYRNGAQPGVIISFREGQGTPEDVEKLIDIWRRKFQGVDNFFRTHITHIPSDITAMEPVDISKPMEVSKDAARSILKGYRVPPEMIGDTENNPYQFSPEKRYAFMLQVEQPITDKIAWGINQYVAPLLEPGHKLFFDYAAFDVVTETEKAQQEMVRADWQSGRITFNEYRQAGNYEVVEGGDFYLLPAGAIAIPANQMAQAPQLITQANTPATPTFAMLPSGNSDNQPVNVVDAAPQRSAFLKPDDPFAQDLRRWQSAALRHYRAGNLSEALEFQSDMIPAALHAAICGALQTITDVDHIYTIFDDADKYRLHDV